MNRLPDNELTGERRVVSAVFADVVNSTTLMETIDPEDWTAVVNGAFEIMTQAVHRYDGTISQLQGDAMVAFFGAPAAHEDDPVRAVRAAFDMVEGIQHYRQELQAARGIDFQIRAGVNTGHVVVGKVGTELHYEYTALGDAMNVAARMQSAARPGTVLITDDTLGLVSSTFDVRDLGPIFVKGRSEPVHAYEVAGLRVTPGRQRGIAGLTSRMVGRGEELEALKKAFAIPKAGRGSMACVLGDPGLGKTRLVSEFKASVLASNGGARWAEGRSSSPETGVPFHLVLDFVRSSIGISAASPDDDAVEALNAVLSVLPAEDRNVGLPLLRHLLSLPVREEEAAVLNNLDPEVLQLRYVSALKQLLNALLAAGPVIMVLEDVHWADQASVELLRRLLALGSPLRTLVCLTSRPDTDAPGWRLITLARQLSGPELVDIRLSPLNDEDSAGLMASLLEIESLPEGVRDKLLDRAEGNPFFIEELIKVLIEQGVIVRRGEQWIAVRDATDVEIPDTLRSLLLSRMDRLSEQDRRCIKVASVLGRQFPARVLGKVLGEPPQPRLDSLEDSGLIRVAAVDPDLEYVFRHSLVQETAYDSLLKAQRRQLHRAVGDAMEELYPERRDELSPELALHFEEAEDERAIGYLMKAGIFSQRRFAIREARGFYERALRLLTRRRDPESTRLRVEATIGAAEAGWTFSNPDREVAALEGVAADAEALGDDRLLVRLYSSIGMLRQYQGERYGVSAEATAVIDRANEIGEKLGDPALRAGPLAGIGWALAQGGDLRQGVALLEEAVPLLEQSGKVVDLGLALDGLAFAYARLGDFKTSEKWLARAEQHADFDPIAKLDFMSIKGAIAMFRNRLDEALSSAQWCVSRADEMGVLSCSIGSHLTIGLVQMMKGRPDLALPHLERGGELSLVSLKFWEPLIGASRATAEAMLGMMEKAVPRWEASLERAQEIGDRLVEASVLQMRSSVAAHGAEPEWGPILSDLQQSVNLFNELEARPFLARALRDYGSALAAAGRTDEAREALERAVGLFGSMELDAEAEMVREALSRLPRA